MIILISTQKKHSSAGVDENVCEIINTDKGIDPLTNEPFKFFNTRWSCSQFYDELHEQRKYLEKSNMLSYNVIEDCLYIGMYKGPFRFLGGTILKLYTTNWW